MPFIIHHKNVTIQMPRGCSTAVSIQVFQTWDRSSILRTRTKAMLFAPVAQWIEQETSKLWAVGSIPTRGTTALASGDIFVFSVYILVL